MQLFNPSEKKSHLFSESRRRVAVARYSWKEMSEQAIPKLEEEEGDILRI